MSWIWSKCWVGTDVLLNYFSYLIKKRFVNPRYNNIEEVKEELKYLNDVSMDNFQCIKKDVDFDIYEHYNEN